MGDIKCTVTVANLHEYEKLLQESEELMEQLKVKSVQLRNWKPVAQVELLKS